MITITFKNGSTWEPVGVRKIELIDDKLVVTAGLGRYSKTTKVKLEDVAELRQT